MGTAGAGDFAKTLGIMQNGENIIVDDKMKTNIDGIFACGDATGGLYQVCKAVYEGAEARPFSSKLCEKCKLKFNNFLNGKNKLAKCRSFVFLSNTWRKKIQKLRRAWRINKKK